MFTVIFILWGSATVGYLLRRHPIPGLERLMTYTVWGLLFLMGVEVGGNPTLMQALDRLGWEALILTLCTALGCALAAAALWSGSRRTIPATQTLTVEKDAGKGLLAHKHRLVALTGRKLHHRGVFRARMCLRRFSLATSPPRRSRILRPVSLTHLRRAYRRAKQRDTPKLTPHRQTSDVATGSDDSRDMGRSRSDSLPAARA